MHIQYIYALQISEYTAAPDLVEMYRAFFWLVISWTVNISSKDLLNES